MHVNEIDNRLRKAQRLLAHIDTTMPGVTASTLALISDESWVAVAEQAGEKAPSNSTISTIIAMVRGRELAIDAIRASIATASGVR